jgi:hypothetical protein
VEALNLVKDRFVSAKVRFARLLPEYQRCVRDGMSSEETALPQGVCIGSCEGKE